VKAFGRFGGGERRDPRRRVSKAFEDYERKAEAAWR
jgi:hypothetical protein